MKFEPLILLLLILLGLLFTHAKLFGSALVVFFAVPVFFGLWDSTKKKK